MDEILEKILFKRFPFMDRTLYPGTDYDYWGIGIPDSWFILVVMFAKEIEALAPDALVLYQIKEKANRIRIYAECEPEKSSELENVVQHVEMVSELTCIECGTYLETATKHSCVALEGSNQDKREWAEAIIKGMDSSGSIDWSRYA